MLMNKKVKGETLREAQKMDREGLMQLVTRMANKLEDLMVILENINDGIYLTDGKANTIFLNQSYEKISGAKREDFLGKSMYQVIDDGLIDVSGTVLALKEQKEVSLKQILSNGSLALITSTPIFEDDKIVLVVTVVRDITELKKLQEEIVHHQEEITRLKKSVESRAKVIYRGKVMDNILSCAARVAKYDSTVLLTGETGVGKDVLSKFIYENSSRADGEFSHINCSTIPHSLIESEFFGYEKGAFTGADSKGKKGIFEKADGGTVFLDEIGELPLSMQASLLHVLQDKKVRRVGGTSSIDVNVRIIAATNRNLEKMVEEGTFREDLYYRLNVVAIQIPPLRARRDDILPLIEYFMARLSERYGMRKQFSLDTLETLYAYDWPGNVRELKNFTERAFILSSKDVITREDLPLSVIRPEEHWAIDLEKTTLPEARAKVEAMLIDKAFEKYKNVTDAARVLDIDASTFVRKRKKYLKEGYLTEKCLKK